MQNPYPSMYTQQGFGGQNQYPMGGQQFGGQGFTQGGVVPAGYPSQTQTVPVQQSYYPNWFIGYTGRQPMQIEQLLNDYFNRFLNHVYTLGYGQGAFGNIQTSGEAQILLNKARDFAFVIMVDKTSGAAQQPSEVIVQRVVECVILGELVRRTGGANMPHIPTISQALNINVVDRFNTYMSFESRPNAYREAITIAENNIRQAMAAQQQQYVQPGFGQPQPHIHPAAMAAVPSGNFAAPVANTMPGYNTGYQQPAGPVAVGHDPASQVGKVASSNSTSIYALAMEQKRAQEAANPQPGQPINYGQPIADQVPQQPAPKQTLNIPADNVKGVFDAFSLANEVRKHGLKAFVGGGDETQSVEEPEVEPTPEVEVEQPAVEKPKSVIPQGWGLNQPDPHALKPPVTGLPNLGMYNMSGGQPVKTEDFQTQPTVEQHVAHSPAPSHYIDDNAAIHDEDDDFLNAIEQHQEAEIQAYHEQERALNPLQATSSMDDLLQEAQEKGIDADNQELRVDFGQMESQSRKNICKKYHIRIVPAYVRGRDRVIQIMKGKVRTIVIEREEDVDYNQHETEVDGVSVFATWDAAARNSELAKNVMQQAASNPVWNPEVFLEKLNEKLEASENENEADAVVGELLAERSIIQIDGALQASGTQGDYQAEVVSALMDRGVEQAGVIVDNAIVEYERAESGCLQISEDNKSLIEGIVGAENLISLVGALNTFRKEATLPVRELARLHHNFTAYLNQYLKLTFSNGWGTTDPIEDQDELIRELLKAYAGELDTMEVMDKLTAVYLTAARKAYGLIESEDCTTVGTTNKVVLLPIYYSQYPIATLDDVGAIQSGDHPELYELLNKVHVAGKDIKIVTLDNYVLTFVHSLGDEDLFYLVDVSN